MHPTRRIHRRDELQATVAYWLWSGTIEIISAGRTPLDNFAQLEMTRYLSYLRISIGPDDADAYRSKGGREFEERKRRMERSISEEVGDLYHAVYSNRTTIFARISYYDLEEGVFKETREKENSVLKKNRKLFLRRLGQLIEQPDLTTNGDAIPDGDGLKMGELITLSQQIRAFLVVIYGENEEMDTKFRNDLSNVVANNVENPSTDDIARQLIRLEVKIYHYLMRNLTGKIDTSSESDIIEQILECFKTPDEGGNIGSNYDKMISYIQVWAGADLIRRRYGHTKAKEMAMLGGVLGAACASLVFSWYWNASTVILKLNQYISMTSINALGIGGVALGVIAVIVAYQQNLQYEDQITLPVVSSLFASFMVAYIIKGSSVSQLTFTFLCNSMLNIPATLIAYDAFYQLGYRVGASKCESDRVYKATIEGLEQHRQTLQQIVGNSESPEKDASWCEVD
jgi:hypothetical protein